LLPRGFDSLRISNVKFINIVKKQNEQTSDSMDEDGTPQAVGTPSLPESKMHTEPKQLATKSAPTVEEPAEKLSPSHTMALQPSCRKGPVLEDPPIGVKISDYYNPDPYSMRMNYLPMVCEHRQTPTTETAGHVSMAHGAPLRGRSFDGSLSNAPREPGQDYQAATATGPDLTCGEIPAQPS